MMKKTFITATSMAVIISMLSSTVWADTAVPSTTANTVSSVKTSADFQDLGSIDADLKMKIDALLAKGGFEGVSTNFFGIDQNMTRAQFAKVLSIIYNLKVDLSVKTSSFVDLKMDDPANGWAIPNVEAAKQAGLIEGMIDSADGPVFAPGEAVTIGQFATALIKGLGSKVDLSGTPWYKDAVKQAIAAKILPDNADGAKIATRADLVYGAFGGLQAFVEAHKAAPISIETVKAVGIRTVIITLDGEVDSSKATLALTKGKAPIATKTMWSDDKKTATLTLTDTNLRAGDYEVTLGGLDAASIKTAFGKFTAQDETLQKIEFVNTSDTIAYSSTATLLVKAINQYNENASIPVGNYTVTLSNGQTAQLSKRDDGLLKMTLDSTKADSIGNPSSTNLTSITIMIYDNVTHVAATKSYTVGNRAFITKVSFGEMKYSQGTVLSRKGDYASVTLVVNDQYGDQIGFKAIQDILGATSDNDLVSVGKVQWNISPFEQNVTAGFQDYSNTDIPEFRLSLSQNVDKAGDYNINVYIQGASASAKVSVASIAVATKVEIGDPSDVIAAGDTDVYVPIIAYDAGGNKLNTDDLISDLNTGRIKVLVSGADALNQDGTSGTNAIIWNSGQNKGAIRLSQVKAAHNGMVTVNAYINSANVNSSSFKSFHVADVRIPDYLKMVTEPTSKIVAGGNTQFKIQAIDQYGKTGNYFLASDGLGNPIAISDVNNVTGAVYYKIKFTPISTDGIAAAVTNDDDTKVAPNTLSPYVTSAKQYNTFAYVNGGSGYAKNIGFAELVDNKYRLATSSDAANGTIGFKAELIKVNTSGFESVVDTLSRYVRVIDAGSIASEGLTYKLNNVSNLFAIGGAVAGGDVVENTDSNLNKDVWEEFKLTTTDMLNAVTSTLAHEVTFSATDASGNPVALPKQITSIVSSDSSVVKAVYGGNGKAYVIGNKPGTATIMVIYKTKKGDYNRVTATVTVKNDPIAVTFIGAYNTTYTTALTGFNVFSQLFELDNYGSFYAGWGHGGAPRQYNSLLGLTFSTMNIRGGKVDIDPYGNVTASIDGTAKDSNGVAYVTYDLTATGPNGTAATMSIIQK